MRRADSFQRSAYLFGQLLKFSFSLFTPTDFTLAERSAETSARDFDEKCRPSVAPLLTADRRPDSPLDSNQFVHALGCVGLW